MIEITMDNASAELAETALKQLSEDKVTKIVQRASKRAATTARKAGTQAIRKEYAIKGVAVVKSGISFNSLPDGTEIRIKGAFPLAQKMYRARKKKKGIFVTIKKGKETLVGNSFENPQSGLFMQRQGKKRLPVKGIYGPALPQLFGNDTVVEAMEKEGMEMYEKRLWHELDRALGGNK